MQSVLWDMRDSGAFIFVLNNSMLNPLDYNVLSMPCMRVPEPEIGDLSSTVPLYLHDVVCCG